jgi:glycine oxidase
MAKSVDVIVVGGGVIGLTTAYFLAREQVHVAVLDQGDFAQEASWAGAGILPAATLQDASTPIDKLRGLSAEMFPHLSEELHALTGIDNGYLRSGGLEFHQGRDEAALEEWHSGGVTCQVLDEPAQARLEPNLAKGLGAATYLPDMAQVRNPRHLKALVAACDSCGVELYPGCRVHGFVREGRRIAAVKTSKGNMAAAKFLLATGAWTDPLLEAFNCQPGIRPVRGQMVLLRCPHSPFRRILLWGNRYLVPRSDGRVLVGSTEENAGFDKRNTAQAVARLLALSNQLVPCLAEAQVERCWAGLRPGSPDGLPFLGQVPECDNLYLAAGHFRSGIQLSPGTAKVMKEWLAGQPVSVSLDAFRVNRR